MRTELLLASHPCSECLLSDNKIVSARRASDIIRECVEENKHFFCHKGTVAGGRYAFLHCRGFNDRRETLAVRFAKQFGIPIVEVDPDNLSPDE